LLSSLLDPEWERDTSNVEVTVVTFREGDERAGEVFTSALPSGEADPAFATSAGVVMQRFSRDDVQCLAWVERSFAMTFCSIGSSDTATVEDVAVRTVPAVRDGLGSS